jgi:excisionase family DNA binding protein
MKTQYTLLSGETVEFTMPSSELGTFLQRVLAAAQDPAVSHGELSELVHGLENPLLDRAVVPGGAIATAEVYRSPLFHAMLDCVARKRLSPDSTAPAPRTRYAMTVPEAAKQLGISESAVRQAIYTNRLRARKEGGTHYLDPRSVASYRVSRRGPRRQGEQEKGLSGGPLEVRIGSGPDSSFRVKHGRDAFELTESRGAEWTGTIPGGWRRIALLGTSGDRAYCWEIEPAEGESVLQFEGFHVRGGFRVVEALSVAQRAVAAFKAFHPR